MTDDPSNKELGWRIDEVRRMLADVVARPEYAARLEAAERRFADIAAAVGRLEAKIEENIARLHERLDEHDRAHAASGLSWRAIIFTAIPSALMVLLGIAVQLWISSGRH